MTPKPYTLLETSMKPDWSKAPEWAQYWAQNANGAAHWWSDTPSEGDRTWTGYKNVAPDVSFCPDWHDSLQERPVDPYAELKAAAKDPTKEIWAKTFPGKVHYYKVDKELVQFRMPPDHYQIRDKPVVKTAYRRLWQHKDGGKPEYMTATSETDHILDSTGPVGKWLGPVEPFTYEEPA